MRTVMKKTKGTKSLCGGHWNSHSNSEEEAAGEDGRGHLEGGPGALKARMKAVRRLSWLDGGPGKKA